MMKTLTEYWIEMMRVRKKIRDKCAKLKMFKVRAQKRLHALHKIRNQLRKYLESLSHRRHRHIGSSRHAGKMMMYRRLHRNWESSLADQEKKLKKLREEERRVNRRLHMLNAELAQSPQHRHKMKNLMKNFEDTVTEFRISWSNPIMGSENLKAHHDAVMKIQKSLKRKKRPKKEDIKIKGLQEFLGTQIEQIKTPKVPKVKVKVKVKASSRPRSDDTSTIRVRDSISHQLFRMQKEDKPGKKVKRSSLPTRKKSKMTTFADALHSEESSTFSFTGMETRFRNSTKGRQSHVSTTESTLKRIVTPVRSIKSTKSTPASQDQSIDLAKLTGEREKNIVETINMKLGNYSTSIMELERANQVMQQAKANAHATLTPTKKQTQTKPVSYSKARRWTFYKKYVDLTGGQHAGAGLYKMLEERQDEKYQQLLRTLSEIIHGPSMMDVLQDSTEVYEAVLKHYMWNNLLEVFNDLKGMVPKHVIMQVLKEQYTTFIDEIVSKAIEEGAKTVIDEHIPKTPPNESVELPNTLASGNDSFDAYIDHSLGLIELNPLSFRASKSNIERVEEHASLERLLSEQLQRMSARYSLDNLKKIYEAHWKLFSKIDTKWPVRRHQEQKKKSKVRKRKHACKHVRYQPCASPTRLFDAPRQTCRERKADEICAECSCDEDEESVARCERCGDPLLVPPCAASSEESGTQLSLGSIEACGKNRELIEWTRDICYICGYVHHEQQPCPMLWPQAEEDVSKRLRYLRLIKEFAHHEQRSLQLCPTRQSKFQLQQE